MDRREQILAIATEAQARIDDAMALLAPSEIAGGNFDQAGLRDGRKIVEEYLVVGGLGVAFDHVLYMITATDVALAASSVRIIEQLAAELGFPAPQLLVQK